MISIDNDIPLPVSRERTNDALLTMEVGSSFALPASSDEATTALNIMYRYNRETDLKFVRRTREEDGSKMVRIWRAR